MKTTFFRKKVNGEKIQRVLQKLFEREFRLHYDANSKFWWVQVEGNLYDPFPAGVWKRADWWKEEMEMMGLLE